MAELLQFVKDYEDIEKSINVVYEQILPLEQLLNNTQFKYEYPNIEDIDHKLTNIIYETKQINVKIKSYLQQHYEVEELYKTIYDNKKMLLKNKHLTLFKKISCVNHKYNLLKKNIDNIHHALRSEGEGTGMADGVERMGEHKDESMLTQTVANSHVVHIHKETMAKSVEVELIALEVKQLFEMFRDISVLINDQTQQICDIEILVNSSKDKIDSANKKIIEAIMLQKKTRKKYCCVAFFCVLILIIIITVSVAIVKN